MLIRWNKAKARTEMRIRIRGNVIRKRIGEARIRTVIRMTAEQHPTQSFRCRYVGVVVIAQISSRAATDCIRYDFSIFSENMAFCISFRTGFITDMAISVVIAISKLGRIGTNKNLA